jgi:superfamily I DNA/RNA helicase
MAKPDEKLEQVEKKSFLQLTAEQEAILAAAGNMKINAVAGSGKTTTIIQYAATRPKGSRILYLAYNRSVKTEAIRRFAEQGLYKVRVETAHSLAYRPIVLANGYTVRQQEYKTYEIADILGLKGMGEKHGEYILANHIHKFTTYFCNSDVQKVQDLNYLDIVSDEKAKTFVRNFYTQIEHGARLLLGKMYKGEIEITHDFYLKRYQLSNPVLPYDYILFDEGQDASPAMLDIFLKQRAVKVIVGDAHQQIYAWRHAVNSLAKAGFQSFALSTSFRFPQHIADLSMQVLSWKNHLQETAPVTINGRGQAPPAKTKATLARSNLGLLIRAITYVTDHPEVDKLYFEGNINSYTYADDGASLYDVLNLYNGRHDAIRDRLVKAMKDMAELEDYIEKTEDVQLGMMVEIVKEYGNELPSLIKELKQKHVGDAEKESAEMIFSTVHRAKGLEYDAVQLVEDFVTEAKLEKLKAEAEVTKEPINFIKWNEEINLLYVAITRTKGLLRIPETLLPKDFPPSPHIQVIKSKKTKEKEDGKKEPYRQRFGSKRKNYVEEEKEKMYDYQKVRLAYKNSYPPWTPELDSELKELYESGHSLSELSEHFGRNKGAILSRLKKMGWLAFE